MLDNILYGIISGVRSMEIEALNGLSSQEAKEIISILNCNESQEKKWQKVSKNFLKTNIPFKTHEKLYQNIYQSCDNHYMSIPSEVDIKKSFLGAWMEKLNITNIPDFHKWSRSNKESFWKTAIDALNIPFAQIPSEIVDLSNGACHPKWLPNAEYNVVDACLSAGPNKIAIVFADENGKTDSWTYRKLTKVTNQVANSLQDIGIKIGDRVAIDMMMTAESVAIYLGVIKAGAEVVSIADSFAVNEIKIRLETSDTKIIFTQDYIDRAGKKIPMYDKVKQSTNIKIISVMHKGSNLTLGDG
ncbi:MAG: acetyl-CoA synthetase, partial [Francisellaceae bacterium]